MTKARWDSSRTRANQWRLSKSLSELLPSGRIGRSAWPNPVCLNALRTSAFSDFLDQIPRVSSNSSSSSSSQLLTLFFVPVSLDLTDIPGLCTNTAIFFYSGMYVYDDNADPVHHYNRRSSTWQALRVVSMATEASAHWPTLATNSGPRTFRTDFETFVLSLSSS